ncbi:ATP-dependent DNA helicase DinG [Paenibacillus radicis (ex Gao et al. 2016)]|uniref:3'-5' exonuclease DinG n=1 Tax=Paenibacillus radicis (ex Gao et al. 2016) TaxID=1737354 RepID=A0A917GW93_9BACL|nr:ATP-dependent DNA helicase DinG [Paenibacillus radicis (ex Gao et al. 2016)]GGG58513.1 ATP-dependent helicase DinG [Paenibacillus radicis (ex Gao et al. 2016)]
MKYAVLDLETTGHSISDEILQVGLVIVNDELDIVDSFNSFVRPTIEIPAFITQLTGIDAGLVADAPELDEVLMQLIPYLDDAVLVAHNVNFDAGFLNQALDRCGYHTFAGRRLDTIELLRILYPSITTYQLGAVSELFGITHDQHHRADSDAMATAKLFAESVRKLRRLPLLTLQRLSFLVDNGSDLSWFIALTLQQAEQQSAIDLNAYQYFNQFAMKAGEWTEEQPARTDSIEDALSDMSFEQYLDSIKQRFIEKFPNYEEREAQTTMFHEVFESLQSDRHLLIEAGTGTGKSLGYLIPSLYYGVKEEKKIVVSTHTINLQEQLRHRDIPLLKDVLPFEFRASIFKGRGNYLCLRKFESKINAKDMAAPVDDAITASQMVVWLGETETGDQEELNFGGKGADFWSTVASDADSCLNRACPWFKRCYYHRAKHEANIADVCITNHSMLFTDVQADHRLLPTYNHLIIDEAHHVEEVASKHLGMQINYFSLSHTTTRLFKDARTGLLPTLRHRLQQEGHERSESWAETIDTIIPVFSEIKEHWEKLFELMYSFVGTTVEGNTENGQSAVCRLRGDSLPSGWEDTVTVEDNVSSEISRVIRLAEKMSSDIKDKIDDTGIQGLVTDLNGALRDLTRIKDDLKQFMKIDQSTDVFWIEASAQYRYRSVQLYAVPIDVSRQLQQYFFNVKDSIVMTSATLSVQKSFQYAEEQLGLEGFEASNRLKTVQLPSPFNYRQQALVMIPRNFPTMKGASGDPQFVSMLVQSLAETAIETKGRMLVLFTSYRMLKQTYEPLKEALTGKGIQVIGQGIDSGNRTKLTRRFTQQPESVLLGTSSFWEGVDIPGDALTCLAIVRLPFQPPNHPLVEAKSELLQKQKLNPFMKLSIPQAVIRFKQGFGRLVRTAKDKGIVILYDTRVIDTYYGKHFLYSLPGPKIETMHTDLMVPRIREWLAGSEAEMEGASK